MLEMRPNCECCDAALPADSERAYICSFECTFCASCATGHLHESCPNCGGTLRLPMTELEAVHQPLVEAALVEAGLLSG